MEQGKFNSSNHPTSVEISQAKPQSIQGKSGNSRDGAQQSPLIFPNQTTRFERFRQASNLAASSKDNQVKTLIYCMGDEAGAALRGLKLSNADLRLYSKVRGAFQSFFCMNVHVHDLTCK